MPGGRLSIHTHLRLHQGEVSLHERKHKKGGILQQIDVNLLTGKLSIERDTGGAVLLVDILIEDGRDTGTGTTTPTLLLLIPRCRMIVASIGKDAILLLRLLTGHLLPPRIDVDGTTMPRRLYYLRRLLPRHLPRLHLHQHQCPKVLTRLFPFLKDRCPLMRKMLCVQSILIKDRNCFLLNSPLLKWTHVNLTQRIRTHLHLLKIFHCMFRWWPEWLSL